MDDDLDDYEATLSPFVRFIRRTERRIRRCQLQATLAEARARVASSRAKTARKGRSRRGSRSVSDTGEQKDQPPHSNPVLSLSKHARSPRPPFDRLRARS